MFGRTKTSQPPAQPSTTTAPAPKPGGKGRPTPSRKEARARNRRPVVGAATLRADATKEEKKAARAARREAAAAERAKNREAMLTGDDRNLPARDKGPVRRFARDYVDARHSAGEYLLVAVLVVLMLSLINIPLVKLVTTFALYLLVVIVAIDTWLLRRRVQRLADAKFGADKTRGVGGYAMMRALQLRRTRLPRAQVARGDFPS